MGIGLQEEADVGMVDAVTDDLRAHTGLQGNCCIRVPKVVERDPWEARGCRESVEALPDRVWVRWAPVLEGKHVVARVVIGAVELTLAVLNLSLVSQSGHGGSVDSTLDRRSWSCLRPCRRHGRLRPPVCRALRRRDQVRPSGFAISPPAPDKSSTPPVSPPTRFSSPNLAACRTISERSCVVNALAVLTLVERVTTGTGSAGSRIVDGEALLFDRVHEID